MTDDPFEPLRQAQKLVDPGYDKSPQMLSDFKSVFFGTPQGQRVFHQIMSWCGILRTKYVKGDPYETHVHLGEQNIGARVWAACIQEPAEKPERQNRRVRHG